MRSKYRNAHVLKAMKEASGDPRLNRRALILFAGLTQEKIAQLKHVTRPGITHTINGTRASVRTQQDIADLLQVNREDLFEDKPRKHAA